MKKVFLVEQGIFWKDEPSRVIKYETISVWTTKERANKVAEALRRVNSLYEVLTRVVEIEVNK